MSQELEIEFKNLLTKDEFNRLLHHFKIMDKHFFAQKNIYFDTRSMCLKQQESALRIRIKGDHRLLTLKQKKSVGILETHQPLSQTEFENMTSFGALPKGDIQTSLSSLCNDPNDHQLVHLGELTTHRAEIPYMNGTLVFDYSTYLNQADYELEYEVSNHTQGQQDFNTLLKAQHIPFRQTKNKIARLFDAIQNITKE